MQSRGLSGGNESGQTTFAPYPLYIQLDGELATVVGGGAVAERKVQTLLEHGASVRLVAPDLSPQLAAWAQAGSIEWLQKRYEPGDLGDCLLVVCATDDRAVNEAVYAEARGLHRLVNVVDVPELCNAIVPSVLRRGRLQIAVSTGGASPSAARDIRRSLEEQFPPYWEAYLDAMAELRTMVKARVPGSMEARTPIYEAMQRSDLLERIARGERIDLEQEFERFVEHAVAGGSSPARRACDTGAADDSDASAQKGEHA